MSRGQLFGVPRPRVLSIHVLAHGKGERVAVEQAQRRVIAYTVGEQLKALHESHVFLDAHDLFGAGLNATPR